MANYCYLLTNATLMMILRGNFSMNIHKEHKWLSHSQKDFLKLLKYNPEIYLLYSVKTSVYATVVKNEEKPKIGAKYLSEKNCINSAIFIMSLRF